MEFLFFQFVVKFSEIVFFNSMFKFRVANKLVRPNQSGLTPAYSHFHQLLSITHEFLLHFNNVSEVRSVFSDLSKAFDKVWYKRLIFILKQNSTSGELLHILSDLVNN